MGAEPEGIGLELGLLGEPPSVRSAFSARANDMAGTLNRASQVRRIFGDIRTVGEVGIDHAYGSTSFLVCGVLPLLPRVKRMLRRRGPVDHHLNPHAERHAS